MLGGTVVPAAVLPTVPEGRVAAAPEGDVIVLPVPAACPLPAVFCPAEVPAVPVDGFITVLPVLVVPVWAKATQELKARVAIRSLVRMILLALDRLCRSQWTACKLRWPTLPGCWVWRGTPRPRWP